MNKNPDGYMSWRDRMGMHKEPEVGGDKNDGKGKSQRARGKERELE